MAKSDDGKVFLVSRRTDCDPQGHEQRTRAHSAQRMAVLLGYSYAGDYRDAPAGPGKSYFVPDDTLLVDDATSLGISSPMDLFGGVVPFPFMATKTISHGTVDDTARTPPGWSASLATRIEPVVLPGYTAFSSKDAKVAVRRLLANGPVRIKRARGIGGSGQTVVTDLVATEAFLRLVGDREIESDGLVVERNLDESVTYSIGSLEFAGHLISYCGTQRSTRSNHGSEVYGGSDLVVVRGSFADLSRATISAAAYHAMTMAMHYEIAIGHEFPAFFASRRNYDVIQGYDHAGIEHMGVLEQSWRFGGASPAELSAIEAFVADPHLDAVRASTYEVYADQDPPEGAIAYYRDIDQRAGALTKYCKVEARGNPA